MATTPTRTDAELVRGLQARDHAAWEELYAAYAPRLRAFAYRLAGNPHDADDLVQETFVRALPRLDRLDPDTVDIAAYLFQTTRNLFLKQVERAGRAQPVEEVPEPRVEAPIEDDPERSTLLARQQEEVRLANARLQPRQRLVLALRELEDRSYAEIGELVGLKENAVAQLVFRARESLRTELRLAQVDPERLPEECRRFLPLLAAHLDGQLKGPRREETLAHLEGCEACQDALAAMDEAKRRYRSLVPVLPGLGELGLQTDDALAANGYWQGGRRAGRDGLARKAALAVGAAALVAAGVGVAVVAGADESAAPATSAAADAPTPPAATRAPAPGDTRAPRARITARPPARTALATAAFSFVADEQGVRYRCSLDGGPARPCTSPATYRALAAGAHRFGVRALDAAGNVGPWAVVRFVVESAPAPATTAEEPGTQPATAEEPDTPAPAPAPAPAATTTQPVAPAATTAPETRPADRTAPTVTITSAPAGSTESVEAVFAFRANEAGTVFSCSLDGAAYAACASGIAYRGLTPGTHTFAVRATDAAGNVGAARARWTIVVPDTTPPTVTIASAPPASTTSTDASFSFVASEAGATFSCSLDGGAFAACASPVAYQGLAPGAHAFHVRATDEAGNTGEPAVHAWTVARPLPDLVVSSLTGTSVVVTNVGKTAAGPFAVTVDGIGTFSVPGLAAGASVTRTWSTCRRGTLTATADATSLVAEANEANNRATQATSC